MDIKKIRDIMVFACNSLVFTLGNVTWNVCDCTYEIKNASKRFKDVKAIKPLFGYCITCYPVQDESYEILLLPVTKNGKPCIIVILPDQQMNCFFFHEEIRKMHLELNLLYKYVCNYINERKLQKMRSQKQRKRR